jgi:ATP-dependent Zn protease
MSDPLSPPPTLQYATPTPPRVFRFGRKLLGWLLFVAVAFLLFIWLKQQSPVYTTVPFSDFYDELIAGNVGRIVIDDNEITGWFTTPHRTGGQVVSSFRAYLPSGVSGSWPFMQWVMENRHGATVAAEPNNNILVNFILPFIPWLLILAFIWFFVFRTLRNRQNQPMPVVVMNSGERR